MCEMLMQPDNARIPIGIANREYLVIFGGCTGGNKPRLPSLSGCPCRQPSPSQFEVMVQARALLSVGLSNDRQLLHAVTCFAWLRPRAYHSRVPL